MVVVVVVVDFSSSRNKSNNVCVCMYICELFLSRAPSRQLDHPNCHYLVGAKTTIDDGGILVRVCVCVCVCVHARALMSVRIALRRRLVCL